MTGLEVIPIHSVTLSDGRGPGERALTRLCVDGLAMAAPPVAARIWLICAGG
jgi:hypothetical protein